MRVMPDATHHDPAGTSTRAQFAKVVVLGFGPDAYHRLSGPTFSLDAPASYSRLHPHENWLRSGAPPARPGLPGDALGAAYPPAMVQASPSPALNFYQAGGHSSNYELNPPCLMAWTSKGMCQPPTPQAPGRDGWLSPPSSTRAILEARSSPTTTSAVTKWPRDSRRHLQPAAVEPQADKL